MRVHLVGPVLALTVACGAASLGIGVKAEPVTSGAAVSQAKAADSPSRHWRRVPSVHFTAVGDAPESVLRDALRELEVFRTALSGLSAVLPAPRYRNSTPLVVVFRDDSSFEAYKPRDFNGRRRSNVGGYYFDDPQGAYIVTAADGQGRGSHSVVVLHEYAHEVLHHTLGTGLPPWLDEGLAELCASVTTEAGSQAAGRWLGRPMARHVAALRRRAGPNLTTLLSTDHVALSLMAPDDAALFYAKSWALSHYVLLGRNNRAPDDVPAFLAELAKGRSPVDAFESAFHLSAADVDAALASYILRPVLPAVPIAETAGNIGDTSAEPLLNSEVEQIQGNLLLQVRDLSGAEARLERSFARNPGSTQTRLSLARLRTVDLRPGAALDLLAPIGATRPTIYTTQLVLGRAQQRAGHYQEALVAFSDATRLAPTGREAWYGLSLTASLLDQAATAGDAMARLQSLEPGPAWYFERARDLWEAGRDDLAVTNIETVLEQETSDTNTRAYAAFLGALSASRLARPTVANDMLAAVNPNALAGWQRTLLALLQGRLTPREVLDRARGAGQQTEAHTYIGIIASVAGRLNDAHRHLGWVRDHGVRTYAEYDMARVELTRLD